MRLDHDDYSGAVALAAPPYPHPDSPWMDWAPAQSVNFLTIIGLIWGLLTGFAFWILPSMGQFSMFAGLVVALILSILYFRSLMPLFAWFTRPAGLLILMHAMAALMSSALSPQPALAFSARYFVVAMAFSLVLCVVLHGPGAIQSMRIGLTAAGLAVVVFHLGYISLGGLSDPTSRVSVYMNPNSVGMVSAITCLSLNDYAIAARKNRQWKRLMFLRASIVGCLLIVLASKSRTAAISLIAGWMVLRTLYFGWSRMMIVGLVVVFLALLLPEARESGLRIYQFDTQSLRLRDPTTLTGRTRIWRSYLAAFEANPLFGASPGGLADTAGLSGHNAIIQYLGELGLAGTVPAVLLVILAWVGAFKNRREPRFYFSIACFVAALVESSTESSLLNSGNPAGLLVLLSIACLATADRRTVESTQMPQEFAY